MSSHKEEDETISASPQPEAKIEAQSSDSFVEGGPAAWRTILGAWLVQFATFGYLNAFGVYQDFYVREYLTNRTSAEISLVGSIQLFFSLALGVVTGQLFDRGYFRHLMILGSLLASFSLFMLSLSHQDQYYQVFLAQGLAQGISIGLTFLPTVAITAHYFQRKRGVAMGLVVTGSSVGGTLHPIMLNRLIFGSVGFHNGVRASAGLVSGLLLIGNLLMQPKYPPRKEIIHPDIPSFFKDKRYVVSIIGTVVTLLGLFFPIFYLQLDAITHGIDPDFAFYTLAILNGASIFGRILPNLLLHSVGVYNLIFFCTAVSAALIFALFGVESVGSTAVFAILYGFFSGAFISLLSPMFSSLAKTPSEMGARMGIAFFFNGCATLLGNPVAGQLLGTSLTWWRPFVWSGVTVACGAFFLLVARGLVAASKGTHKV